MRNFFKTLQGCQKPAGIFLYQSQRNVMPTGGNYRQQRRINYIDSLKTAARLDRQIKTPVKTEV